jgi:hypothetical protein
VRQAADEEQPTVRDFSTLLVNVTHVLVPAKLRLYLTHL